MSFHPENTASVEALKVAITMEPESWILRRFGGYFQRFVSPDIDCRLLELDEPMPADTDAIIYANWSHLYDRPPLHRNMPGIMMVGHMDRTAFRFRYLLWRYPGLQVVCMAQRWVDTLRRYLIPESRLHLIPHGIDLEMFQPALAVPKAKRTRIGFVGRAYPDGRKGEDRLVELSRQLNSTEYEFVLVGDRWEGIVAQLREAGFEVAYHARLKTEEIPPVLASMDTLLVCARNEGGPQPVLEALACGVPVLSTDVGFVPDLQKALPEQVTIYQNIGDTVAALAQAKQKRRAAQAQIASVRRDLEPYTWQSWAKGLEGLSWAAAGREVPDQQNELQPEAV